MTVASDIVTALAAATWTTISKPTLTEKQKKEAELTLGTGWVWSGKETIDNQALGSGTFGERETPFEIYIANESAANYALYKSNLETLLPAISVTGGWIEVTGFPEDNTLRRYSVRCVGRHVKVS